MTRTVASGRPSHRAMLRVMPAVMVLLAGCSVDSSIFSSSSDSGPKKDLGLTRDWNLFAKEETKTRAITANDLVGPDGTCAEEATSSSALNFTAGPQASTAPGSAPAPLAPPAPRPGGIGLDMSECDVVRAAGHTDQVDISTNARGERAVVLTYLTGDRAGIYRFESGRLKSIERAPGAVTEPAKPKKPTKKQAAHS